MPRSYLRTTPSGLRAGLLTGGLAVVLLAPLTPAALAQEASPTADPSATASPTPVPTATSPAPQTTTAAPSAGPTTSSPSTAAPTTAPPTVTPTAPAPSASPTPASSPVLRLGVSRTLVSGNGALTVSGRYYRAPNSPGSGVALDVLGRTPGTTGYARLGRMTTGPDGLATLQLVPRVSREYLLRTATAPAVTSSTAVVAVQPVLVAALTPRLTQVGGTGVVSGRLLPAYAGAPVLVQRRLATGWSTVRTVTPDGTGAFRAVLAADALGRHVYRAALVATPAHRSASSALLERVVEGRSLREGDRGPDVLSLQQRLAAQHVDVGAVDGVFGYDLRHAVTAFQKSQGLARTGVYDKATSTRLAAPRAVQLRYPARGRAVEVDIAKQVLYVSEGGRLTRIVDVSTGSDRLYESDGVTYKAYTPTGRFRVERKIDGVRVSRLGELYRPAYFTQGWAVHGSPNVPVYPDSHGCVRVTDPAMDRLFGLLTVGTPVSVYR
ncbi:MAG: hypothetical protein JWN17_2062 [Frankiales bacterium]|nr:hypothetical protein [Frankiales bacterium]